MDFGHDEDRLALRELARKILEERSGHARLREVEASEPRLDLVLWQELASANLLGAAIEERFGGSGFGWEGLALLLVEVGRATAPLPVLPTLAVAAPALAACTQPKLGERWLPRLAAGEAIFAVALEEPGGAPPHAPETRATRSGPGWRIDGAKQLVAAAHVAERVLVPASSEAGCVALLVDPAAPGVHATCQETTTGEPRYDLVFEDVEVPPEEELAGPERGGALLRAAHAHALAGVCALQLGVAERALERTAAYVSERRQFDRPIGSFQAVHQRAADAFIDLEAMRLTLWRAVHLLECGEPAEEALAVAKYWAAEAGSRVSFAAQHLHGGIGLDVDHPLHRHYLWSRDLALQLGGADEQLAQLGDLLGAQRPSWT